MHRLICLIILFVISPIAHGEDEYFLGKWTNYSSQDFSELLGESGYELTLEIKSTIIFSPDKTEFSAGVVQFKLKDKSKIATLSTHAFATSSQYNVSDNKFIETPSKCIVHEEKTIPAKGNLVFIRKTLDTFIAGMCNDKAPLEATIKKINRNRFQLISDGIEVEYDRSE